MCATAVDPVFIPRQRVHERLDEQPKGMRFIELKFLE